MSPDKQLEERVLSDCSEYLTNNLPTDDIAPVMLTRNLLTPKEHDEYKTMKRSGRSTMADMSEYLLECLRRRQAGFLKKFCGILWEIEAAKYLGDFIQKSYREANLHGGVLTLNTENTWDTSVTQNSTISNSTNKTPRLRVHAWCFPCSHSLCDQVCLQCFLY